MLRLTDFINYWLGPSALIFLLTPATQYLTFVGNPSESNFSLHSIFGNSFSWQFVGVFVGWAIFWLVIPAKRFQSLILTDISYQANGEMYFVVTTIVFSLFLQAVPDLAIQIFNNTHAILATLNVFALALSLYLLLKYKVRRSRKSEDDGGLPLLYEFYQGVELAPKVWGVDVKQFTNCRVGMMLWELLILASLMAGWHIRGFNFAHLCNVLIQSYYIFVFFRWETGYFSTLDFTMDKTGWMLIWGCLVWIPSLYTFSSYYLVLHPSHLGIVFECVILMLGMISVFFHNQADTQKDEFKKDNRVKIWGKQSKFLEVEYIDSNKVKKKARFLISGWWGVGRKMNYALDILSTFSWCLCAGLPKGFWPYSCFFFVSILLVHRIFRDEEKCKTKYGKGWDLYCSVVKYRLIPFLF